jgi:predicted Zn-dependent peptidase
LISEIPPEDEAPLKIAAEILGEKMAFQLRERQGLAYSISAEVEVRQGWGYFSAFMGTAPDNLETALAGLKEQIMQAGKGGFTVKEVERAANSFMGARNMRLLTSINRAYYLGIYAFKGLPLNYGEKWSEKVKAVSVDEVNRCAQKYFKLDNLVTVVVE